MSYQQEQPDSRRTARRLAEAARDRVATHSRASALRDFPEATGSFAQSELPSRRSLRAQQALRPEGARSSFERSRPASQEQQLTSRRALRERDVSQPDSVWAETPLRAREVPRITEQSQESVGLDLGEQASRSEEFKQWQPPAQKVTSSAQPVPSRRTLRAVQSADGDFDENLGGTLTRRQLREREAARLASPDVQAEPTQHSVMEWPEAASDLKQETPAMPTSAAPVPLTRAALRAQEQELSVQAEPEVSLSERPLQSPEQVIPRRPMRPQPAVRLDEAAEQLEQVPTVPDQRLTAAPIGENEQSADTSLVNEKPEDGVTTAAAEAQVEQHALAVTAEITAEPEQPFAALENTARRRWLDEQDSMVRNTPPGGIGLGELSLTGSLYPAALIMPQPHPELDSGDAVNPYMVTGSINLSKKLSETGTIQPLDSYDADHSDDEFHDYSSSAPVGDPMRASNSISAQALDKSVGFAPIQKKNTLAIVMISLGAAAALALVTTLAVFLPGLLQ